MSVWNWFDNTLNIADKITSKLTGAHTVKMQVNEVDYILCDMIGLKVHNPCNCDDVLKGMLWHVYKYVLTNEIILKSHVQSTELIKC
jgi:hypothetical protein